MKFQLSRRQLLEVLTPIQAIIPARTTLPILHNLKLTAEKGKLLFEATDLDVCLSRSVGATVRSEGSLLVPAKRLYDVVRELPDLEVKVEQTDLTLVVACERSVFKLPAINTEDYPKVPEPAEGDSVKKVRLGVSSLLRAVDKVSFAISTDENRPVLCGLLWQLSEDGMRLVATDGHRLALMWSGFGNSSVRESARGSRERRSEKEEAGHYAGDEGVTQVIVPQKALHLLDLVLKPYSGGESEIEVDVFFGESRLGFDLSLPRAGESGNGESVYLSCGLISGVYPEYRSVLPKDNDRIVRVGKDDVARSLRRVAIFSDPYSHLVKLSIEPERMSLSASSPQSGEAYDEIECAYVGDGFEIGYNAHYLLEIVKRIDDEEIKMELKSPVDAGIFVPHQQREHEELVYLLMPIRLG